MFPMASRLIPALITCTLNATSALAADIYWAPPIEADFKYVYPAETIGDPTAAGDVKSFATIPHLRVEGPIEKGDADKLGAMLREEKPNWTVDMFKDIVVSFNSDGGDFYEGLAIADMISGLAAATFVGPDDRCLSSCAIAFLGGSAIVLRGIPSWPSRYIHVDGVLGFHAPFSEIPTGIQIPAGTPLTDGLTQQMAQSFYGQAQAAINEIAGRISDWQISSDFVFGMLTKDSYIGDTRPIEERFVLVDSYLVATQIKANVLTSTLEYPAEITGVGASAACSFLVQANTGRAFQVGLASSVESLTNPNLSADGTWTATSTKFAQGRFPEVTSEMIGYATHHRMVPGNDPDAFFTEGILSGIGPIQCSAYRGDDGQWYARTFNGNIHYPDGEGTYVRGRGADLTEIRVLDFEQGYPINRYLLLGDVGSWSRAPELYAAFPEWLPDWTSDIKGPSFDCDGNLDPAANVICKFPALADADGHLGALYSAARKKLGDVVLEEQRAWIRARDRVCRPERVDLNDDFIRWNLALCLMEMTGQRNQTLAMQLQ
ncbi:lysozyme inhibitor LprI family protein [Lentibacter sp. XHP0401]|uniref:lysozyme inhibitor LprI family protein n=1 Tax=Lentibacter sp. XHP0401 TaxID=2984334 RepID=UPI0021E8D2BD|nr:lysozyme inhibitor LprI family protein [Lentibacter sp. XHP0401]MCV2893435.1 lysozyme inhibitor LprI family protein [Lentibacter sp. XHP0401]